MGINEAPHRPDDEDIDFSENMALEVDEEYAVFMIQAAIVAIQQKKTKEAFDLLKALVLLQPNDTRVYETFGMVHQSDGDTKNANICFEYALSLSPDAMFARVNLGEHAWRRDKDAERAKELLSHVVKKDGEDGPFGRRAKLTLDSIDKK